MKKTVLIIGASSFVGSNLALYLKDHFRVIGTYHKTPIDINGVTCYPCDVFKKDYVSSLIGVLKPDYTIYAVGMSSLTECKLYPKQADALNSVGAVNVCSASERYGAKFILISSCFVMGGENLIYKESDTPFPNTIFGSSLSSSEYYVQRSCLNYLVLRCAPLYGRSYGPKHPNWFELLQAAYVKGEPFTADDNVVTGFLDVLVLARILKSLFESGVTNRLFQISSSDFMTRYEFAKLVAKTFKKDDQFLQKSTSLFPADAPSSSGSNQFFYKLDSQNTENFLGLKMPTVEESLILTQKRLTSEILT
jgi:dTDP-4-dehydrorhamnose reductase